MIMKALSIFFILSIIQFGSLHAETVYQKILDNIYTRSMQDYNGSSCASWATAYMNVQNADGSFSDVDYDNTDQTNWVPTEHYMRMVYMSVAYVSPSSLLKGNDNLYNAINNALVFWADKKPKSTNWWYQSIGWPQNIGLALCIMRSGEKKLPASTEKAIYDFMKSVSRDPGVETGANKQDVALHWIYFHTLMEDKAQLDYGVQQYYEPMACTTDEGLQHDYSYHQHKHQLYTAGYGGVILTAFFKAAFYLKGTEYENPSTIEPISNFIRLGYIPIHRAGYTFFNTGGRGHLGRVSALINQGFSGQLLKMAEIDTAYADYYKKVAQRFSGEQAPDYAVEPMHYHYWRSDYAVHHRPGYSVDFRTVSTRTCRSENGNNENVKGYFACDGCTEIVVDGNEYVNIFPVWDWAMIPGTTLPHMTKIPLDAAWGQYGQSTFTGGVSNDAYGCATYHYVDNDYNVNTAAKKSWFCFDNEVICMGTNISSTSNFDVNTTINQTLLLGDVTAETSNGTTATLEKGEHEYSDLRWLNQNKVSYFFPENTNITIRNAEQSGDWHSVSPAITDETVISKDVFLAYIKHGAKPTNGNYLYYIIPNTSSIDAAKMIKDSLTIINSDTLQLVYNHNLNILQAIFHQPCKHVFNKDFSIESDVPCAIMITEIGTANAKVYISDPSYTLSAAHLHIYLPNIHAKSLEATFDTSTEYQGKTIEYAMSDLPDYTYYPVESIQFKDELISLSYSQLLMKPELQISPANATAPSFTYRSDNDSVAAVGADGSILAIGYGETTIHAYSSDGPVAQIKVKVADDVVSVEPEIDSYVSSTNSSVNYGKEDILKVRHDGSIEQNEAFVRFPLNYLDNFDDISTCTVELKALFSALHVEEDAPNERLLVYPCNSGTWKEDRINWSNKPSTASTLVLKTNGSQYPSESYIAENNLWIDATSYGMKRYNAGYKVLTLNIHEDAYTKRKVGGIYYGSRENANPMYRPRLYFHVSGGSVGISSLKRNNEYEITNQSITSHTNQRVSVYTIDGKQIMTRVLHSNESVSLKHLASGVYIIQIGNNKVKVTL